MRKHTVQRSLFIDAPIETVWESVGDFGGQVKWLPISEPFDWSGDPNTPGTERSIHPPDTTPIRERLNYRDHHVHKIGYSMVESPFPLTDHEATIEVAPEGTGSKVTWTATFQVEEDDARQIDSMMGTQTFENGLVNLDAYIQNNRT